MHENNIKRKNKIYSDFTSLKAGSNLLSNIKEGNQLVNG